MKEYITIKGVGPLRDINELEILPITVLIGESAIGKSTLMKLVSMMRYLYKMANIRSYLKHSRITSSPFRVRFDTMIKNTGLQSMLGAESFIEYAVLMDNGHRYSVSVCNKRLGKLPIIDKEDLLFTKISFISENRNIIPIWAEKASVNAGATLGFYFHETNNDFTRASEADQVVSLDYVNLKLHITHPKGKAVRYRVEHIGNAHVPIDLREASSGIQTSAPLALIVKHFAHEYSFKDAFNRSVLSYLHEIERLTKFKAVAESSDLENIVYVHVEEPELSLFPDAQCKLVDELVFAATHAEADRKVNMMFATHSPYILNYLNVVLNQTDTGRASLDHDSLAVYRLFDGQAQSLLAQDENGRWIVDTYDLTEMMNCIYNEYSRLVR